jgi:imidazolonepropionase-like amidohydrolase
MTDARTILTNQTVVVEDGRITRLGPANTVKVPAGAQRIDGSGRYLMPGLADMHVHLEYIEDPRILKLFVAHGVTTVRSMDGRPFILDWRRRIAAGGLVGPTIVTAGTIIDGKPPLREDNLAVATVAEAVAAVNQQAQAGYDFIKVYTNLSAEAYRGVLTTAAARRLTVTGHIPKFIEVGEAAAAQRSIEHLADYGEALDARPAAEARRWHWSKRYLAIPIDASKIAALAKVLVGAGTWTVPTLVQADRELATDAQQKEWLGRPEMALVPESGRSQWRAQVSRSSARLDAADWEIVKRGHANRLALTAALRRAGARLLVGTDTPNPFVVPGASVADELRNFVAAGFSHGEALLAATREPARFFRQEKAWGTVEKGKRADLLLLDANPLTDVSNVRRLRGVMLKGNWIPQPSSKRWRRNSPALVEDLC